MTSEPVTVWSIEETPDRYNLVTYRKAKHILFDIGPNISEYKGIVSGASLEYTKAQSCFTTDSYQVSVVVSQAHNPYPTAIPLPKVSSGLFDSNQTRMKLEMLVNTLNGKVLEVWNRRNQSSAEPSAPMEGLVPGQPIPNWQPGMPMQMQPGVPMQMQPGMPMQISNNPILQYNVPTAVPLLVPLLDENAPSSGYVRHPSFTGIYVYNETPGSVASGSASGGSSNSNYSITGHSTPGNISGSGQTTVYGLGNVKVSGSESTYRGGTGAAGTISVSGNSHGSGFNASMNSNGGINVSGVSYTGGLGGQLGVSVPVNLNGVHANTTLSNFSFTGIVRKTLGW